MGLEKLGGLSAVRGQADRAATLLGAAEVLRKRKNAPVESMDQDDHRRFVQRTRRQLDETTFTAAWQDGRAMPLEQAIALGLSLT